MTGDLGEDAGERNHQLDSRSDMLLLAVREYNKIENHKSSREAKNSNNQDKQ